MKIPFLKAEHFDPKFPIIPLFATEDEACQLLKQIGAIVAEEPGKDASIAHKKLAAENDETRIAVGIWNGRVRFVNYLTSQFNDGERQKAKKLRWFVDYYGGINQFDEPSDLGHMIWWRNPSKKLLLLFGVHMGPVRIIDEDNSHWTETASDTVSK